MTLGGKLTQPLLGSRIEKLPGHEAPTRDRPSHTGQLEGLVNTPAYRAAANRVTSIFGLGMSGEKTPARSS
ncbi:MAG TPA: hypothetical protein PK425_05425, partial [Syntrophales bacterium]|nr:hypothetical protein [Syntrophales bacterium]